MILVTLILLAQINASHFDKPVRITSKQSELLSAEAVALRKHTENMKDEVGGLEAGHQYKKVTDLLSTNITNTTEILKKTRSSFAELAPAKEQPQQSQAIGVFFADITNQYLAVRKELQDLSFSPSGAPVSRSAYASARDRSIWVFGHNASAYELLQLRIRLLSICL